MFNKVKSFFGKVISKAESKIETAKAVMNARAHTVLDGTVAEAYVDTGVKILIAVVIGAFLLTLLYALFNDTIMPSVTEKVEGLFDYAG